MALHRLTSITLGVPDVAATAGFFVDFGLARSTSPESSASPTGSASPASSVSPASPPDSPVRLATRDGGEHWDAISPDLARQSWAVPANAGT